MEIQETRHGAVTVVKPVGPIVGPDAAQLKGRLETVASRSLGRFVVDATAIAFVDSLGLEAIVELAERQARTGQTLKMCGANETIREVMDLTDVSHLFEQFADVTDAARSFL